MIIGKEVTEIPPCTLPSLAHKFSTVAEIEWSRKRLPAPLNLNSKSLTGHQRTYGLSSTTILEQLLHKPRVTSSHLEEKNEGNTSWETNLLQECSLYSLIKGDKALYWCACLQPTTFGKGNSLHNAWRFSSFPENCYLFNLMSLFLQM